MQESFSKAYIVAVDMGYGHQRAVFPLSHIATIPAEWNTSDCSINKYKIISANDYPDMPRKDKMRWDSTRGIYNIFSRMRGIPFFGKTIFQVIDYFEEIPPFYPRRDLSSVVEPLKITYRLINKGLGRHLINILNKDPLPIIASFPIIAFMAEEHGYKGEIYCLCTDTDISRVWAPMHPEKSHIKYLAPTERVKERLILYGVKTENIIASSFPLPKKTSENISDDVTLRRSLARRIVKLDPLGIYRKKYMEIISRYLGNDFDQTQSNTPLVIMFSVGGAGAQSDIGVDIIKSLKQNIIQDQIKLILAVGTSKTVKTEFETAINNNGLDKCRGQFVDILYRNDKFEYFDAFNRALEDTDILWTKPSELSFYTALGLPIITSPTLGRQEECNKSWLQMIGAGFEQLDPQYTDEWIFDWLNSGWLARAAMNGFINGSESDLD